MKRFRRILAAILVFATVLPLVCTAAPRAALAAESYKLYFGPQAKTTFKNTAVKPLMTRTRVYEYKSYRHYVFLPPTWDHTKMKVYMTGISSVTLNGKKYKNGDNISLPLNKSIRLQTARGTSLTLIAMQSAKLPTMYITTASKSWTKLHESKDYREKGSMQLVNANGTVQYSGGLEYIRIRGNSSAEKVKKPYQFKLSKSASLCGMEKDKTYCLLANFLDPSNLRNKICLDIARYSGAYAYVPDAEFVDVYLNNDYRGVYLLTEKNEIDKDRLNITNLEKKNEKLNGKEKLPQFGRVGKNKVDPGTYKYYKLPQEPEDYTGGYLVLLDHPAYYTREASGFVSRQGQPFTIQEPKYASKKQVEYISSVVQHAEDALFSKSGKDPATGKHYTELIDLNTMVHRYLQAEVVNDHDGQRPFIYKDSDKVDTKIYFGPVWDQDSTFGASHARRNANEVRIYKKSSRSKYFWFPAAYQHSDFRKAVQAAYRKTYVPAMNILLGKAKDPKGVLKSLDQYAAAIKASAYMDLARWPINTRHVYKGMNTHSGNTLEESVQFIKTYIAKHKAVLDKLYGVRK